METKIDLSQLTDYQINIIEKFIKIGCPNYVSKEEIENALRWNN